MLPNIQSEHSGELDGSRQVRATERVQAALARAPQTADRGEVERYKRVDGVDISPRGERMAEGERRVAALGDEPPPRDRAREAEAADGLGEAREEAAPAADTSAELSAEEQRRVRELERLDRVVRAQENVHRAVAPEVVSGDSTFEFEVGPDGRRYAVRGETRIELPRSGDPDQIVHDAQLALRAALAPAQVSSEDRVLAMRAAGLEARARAQIQRDERAALRDELAELRERAAAAYREARPGDQRPAAEPSPPSTA